MAANCSAFHLPRLPSLGPASDRFLLRRMVTAGFRMSHDGLLKWMPCLMVGCTAGVLMGQWQMIGSPDLIRGWQFWHQV